MDKLNHAPSTLSLSSSDTGIEFDILVAEPISSIAGITGSTKTLLPNSAVESSRILVPSFEAIKNAFGKLYDINDFDLEKIASGFFGDVYKAQYKPTGEIMVVKCNKKSQGKMLKEVELMRRLGDHPNIIKFKGGCVDGARVYSLTDYMNGGTLEQLLTDVDEPIAWLQREKLCLDTACGMQFLHAKGYMHRDLTTKNILIRTDSSVAKMSEARYHAVVADFGLATEIPQRCGAIAACSSTSSNKPLAVVGSAWWMAPECIELAIKAKFTRTKERTYNERVDVFSYGIVVCQVCARIEADPEYLQRTANYGVDYMALSKLVEDDPIARHLMLLAMDCTKYSPEDRPTFAQIADRLCRSRTYGPGHLLIDKRFRNRPVWKSASPTSFLSPVPGSSSTSITQSPVGIASVPPSPLFVSSPSTASASQLPQVWVHTVIRTIDPDFRPARSNPFAALEDHFRDGRKMVRLLSSGLGSLSTEDCPLTTTVSPVRSPQPRLDSSGFYELKLSEISYQIFGSLSEGFGDSTSSVSAGSSCVPSLHVMSPPSSVSPFTPVHIPPKKFASISMEAAGDGCNDKSSRAVCVTATNHLKPDDSKCTVLDGDGKKKGAVRSLPNSPCSARRSKSVYVGRSTSIRYFSPSLQQPVADETAHFNQNEIRDGAMVSGEVILSSRSAALSRHFPASAGNINRVVWSRVRFFETLSQEQQQRWHLMIASNKMAEEQRRAFLPLDDLEQPDVQAGESFG